MCGPKPCELENCTWSEKHRMACEARAVLSWPLAKRREYLARIGKRADALKAAISVEWDRQSALRSLGL